MKFHSLPLLSFLFLGLTFSSYSHAEFRPQIRQVDLTEVNSDLRDPSMVINKMTVEEIQDSTPESNQNNYEEVVVPYKFDSGKYLKVDNALMFLDQLVSLGERIIPLIEKGKAVYNTKNMDAISVIPTLSTNQSALSLLSNWTIPVTKSYQVNFSNLYGINVVSFIYSVTFQYNGSYGGKGKYLTGVRVATRDVKVLWGFDVDAHSELVQISNVGTSDNVIAGATIEITYTVGNVMNVISTSESFHVTGDGRLYKLD